MEMEPDRRGCVSHRMFQERLQTPESAERVSCEGGRTPDQPPQTEEDTPDRTPRQSAGRRRVSRKPDLHRGRSPWGGVREVVETRPAQMFTGWGRGGGPET